MPLKTQDDTCAYTGQTIWPIVKKNKRIQSGDILHILLQSFRAVKLDQKMFSETEKLWIKARLLMMVGF